MGQRTSNGEDVLKKLTALFVPVPRKDPTYHNHYMKLHYRRERIPPTKKKKLERKGDELLRELEEALNW